MTPDPNRDAEQLLIEAAELSSAANDLIGAAGTAHAMGTDGGGQIEVRLASDGTPEQIHVHAGWTRHLEPSRLGTAVIEAAEDAARTATRQWSNTLTGSGWLDREADLGTRRVGAVAGVPDSGGLAASALDELLADGQVRDVNELAETVIKALQNAAVFSEHVVAGLQQPPAGEGTDDSRHVQVTIIGGRLTGCRIDEDWAGRRDGHTLGAALTQAACRLAAALPSRPTPQRGAADALLADVLATARYDSNQQTGTGATGLNGQGQHR